MSPSNEWTQSIPKCRQTSRHRAFRTWCTFNDRQRRIRHGTKSNSSPRPGRARQSLRYVEPHPHNQWFGLFPYLLLYAIAKGSCVMLGSRDALWHSHEGFRARRGQTKPASGIGSIAPNFDGVVMPSASGTFCTCTHAFSPHASQSRVRCVRHLRHSERDSAS